MVPLSPGGYPGFSGFNDSITRLTENVAVKQSMAPKNLFHSPVWTHLPLKSSNSFVISSGADGRLRAFHKVSGSLSWATQSCDDPEQLWTNDTVVVSQGREGFSVHRSEDGAKTWGKEGRDEILRLTDRALLTAGAGEVKARSLVDGQPLWAVRTHQKTALTEDTAFLVGGVKGRQETIEARRIDDGRLLWQTSDGDIQDLVPGKTTFLYTSVKVGEHKEDVTYLSSRNLKGEAGWSYRCQGKLRQPPVFSPDESRVAVVEQHPIDPSRSLFTLLDAQTGASLYSVPAAFQTEPTFLKTGEVALAETEFSRIPDQEEKRFRLLDMEGRESFRLEGRPDWSLGGERLVVARGDRLEGLSLSDGSVKWSRRLSGPVAPVTLSEENLTILVDGCEMVTLNTADGEVKERFCSGDKLFVEAGSDYFGDHEGRAWQRTTPDFPVGVFGGAWKTPESTQYSFLSGPCRRGDSEAVFVDWDGDNSDDGRDPVLIKADNTLVGWSELVKSDADGDGRLETDDLRNYRLWFDLDGDGQVSSAQELSDLIEDSSFDKGRFELTQNKLWLAYQSGCRTCEQ